MPWLIAVAAAGLGAAIGGVPGFFIGGLLGYVVGRELDIRKRLRELKETQNRLHQLQVWATEMKAWSEQAYARMSSLEDSEESMDPQPGTDTAPDTDSQPGVSARPEPVPRPVASEPQTAARVDVPARATPAPPDPATRAPHPAGSNRTHTEPTQPTRTTHRTHTNRTPPPNPHPPVPRRPGLRNRSGPRPQPSHGLTTPAPPAAARPRGSRSIRSPGSSARSRSGSPPATLPSRWVCWCR